MIKIPKFNFHSDSLFYRLPTKAECKKGGILPFIRYAHSAARKVFCSITKIADHKTSGLKQCIPKLNLFKIIMLVDAMHHIQCNINFRTNKSIPMAHHHSFDGQKLKAHNSKPQDTLSAEVFIKIIKYFNNNHDEQITIEDLRRKITDFLNGVTPYTEKHMRMKLEDHFCGNMIDTLIREKHNIVTHHSTVAKILENFSKSSKEKDT